MKVILLIILFSSTSFAKTYFPVGKSGAKTIYKNIIKCEQIEGQVCFDVTNKDPRWHEPQTNTVDDLSKPIYKPKYNLESCDSTVDCEVKMQAKSDCTSGDYPNYTKNQLMPGYSLFCMGIASYEQHDVTTIVESAALKTSVQAADAAKAQEAAAFEQVNKNMAFGVRMVGFMAIRNAAKNLTTAQSKQMILDLSTINALLRAGALETAKEEITATTADGVLITQADKDAVLAEINAYLGQ